MTEMHRRCLQAKLPNAPTVVQPKVSPTQRHKGGMTADCPKARTEYQLPKDMRRRRTVSTRGWRSPETDDPR